MSDGDSFLIALPASGDGSATTRVADELALAIHLGRIAPGLPLREVELAAAHGVSRTIVRAALQRLEAQGLADITHNKGARVRQLEPAALGDMLELHVELTSLAARQATLRGGPVERATIRQFVDMMEQLADAGGTPEAFQHLRVGFARALFEAAGPVLAERLRTAAPVTPHHARAMADLVRREGQAEVATLARGLFEAIESGSPHAAALAAETMLRRHAERTRMSTMGLPKF